MKKGRIYTNDYGDHGQLTEFNQQVHKTLVEIVRTLLLLLSHIDPALHLVINFDVIVNEVVLFASRIS